MKKITVCSILLSLLCVISMPAPVTAAHGIHMLDPFIATPQEDTLPEESISIKEFIKRKVIATHHFIKNHATTIAKCIGCVIIGTLAYQSIEHDTGQARSPAEIAQLQEFLAQENQAEIKEYADQGNISYPPRRGIFTPATLARLNIQLTHPVRQRMLNTECGVYALANAMSIDTIIGEAEHQDNPEINLSRHTKTHANHFKQITRILRNKTENIRSGDIERAKTDNVLVIEYRSPLLKISVNWHIEELKGSRAHSAACHFIFNLGGHWVLFTVRKIGENFHYYYTDSGSSYGTIPSYLHSYVYSIVLQVNPHIFTDIPVPERMI